MHSAGRRGRGRSVADSRDETSWVGTGQTAMELNQVSYFVNLTETLNFTAAARLSAISQPSLTREIRRLEEHLGGPLISRAGTNRRITSLGQDVEIGRASSRERGGQY